MLLKNKKFISFSWDKYFLFLIKDIEAFSGIKQNWKTSIPDIVKPYQSLTHHEKKQGKPFFFFPNKISAIQIWIFVDKMTKSFVHIHPLLTKRNYIKKNKHRLYQNSSHGRTIRACVLIFFFFCVISFHVDLIINEIVEVSH